jgi:aminopeptidase YwaD
VQSIVERMALRRLAKTLERQSLVPADEAENLARFRHGYEREVARSIERFAAWDDAQRRRSDQFLTALKGVLPEPQDARVADGLAGVVFRRNGELKGPMSAFGYSYVADKLGAERVAALTLSRQAALWGDGDYTYEVLNLVDGTRNVNAIRDAASAIYGPVPLAPLLEYLRALESIDVVHSGIDGGRMRREGEPGPIMLRGITRQ